MKTAKAMMAAVAILGACLLLACGGGGGGDLLEQQASISECGGFGGQSGDSRDVPAGYCDAELLRWQHEGETLSLTDSRVSLNCCGDHDIQVELQDGVYVVTETDAPQVLEGMPEGARCACMCVFDFNLVAQGIPAGVIQVRLDLVVTDAEEPLRTVWQGELDLSQGSGEVTVSSAEAPFCGL